MISIRMFKLYGDSIWKQLEIIFKNCLKRGIFSDKWKENQYCTSPQKNYKQILLNY